MAASLDRSPAGRGPSRGLLGCPAAGPRFVFTPRPRGVRLCSDKLGGRQGCSSSTAAATRRPPRGGGRRDAPTHHAASSWSVAGGFGSRGTKTAGLGRVGSAGGSTVTAIGSGNPARRGGVTSVSPPAAAVSCGLRKPAWREPAAPGKPGRRPRGQPPLCQGLAAHRRTAEGLVAAAPVSLGSCGDGGPSKKVSRGASLFRRLRPAVPVAEGNRGSGPSPGRAVPRSARGTKGRAHVRAKGGDTACMTTPLRGCG